MLEILQPSTFNLKRGVQPGKIGRNLNHSEVILRSVYHGQMNIHGDWRRRESRRWLRQARLGTFSG
jgi:hypothetical protein